MVVLLLNINLVPLCDTQTQLVEMRQQNDKCESSRKEKTQNMSDVGSIDFKSVIK